MTESPFDRTAVKRYAQAKAYTASEMPYDEIEDIFKGEATRLGRQPTMAEGTQLVITAMKEKRARLLVKSDTSDRDDLPDLVKAEVAKALRTLPRPGGPARMRTTQETADSVKSDRARMRAEAEELLVKADQTEGTLSNGYRRRAEAILNKLT